jgi:hypothetical protein
MELQFHSRGYEQPPHRRACGTTNSGRLASDLCSSSDGPRTDAAAGRLSFTSPRGGREPDIKAKEPEVADGLVGGEAFSSCHHLSTDGDVHLPTNTAPAGAGRPKAHLQVLTPVLITKTRMGPSQNMSVTLTAYDVLGDPLVRLATVARTKDGMLHPGWAATVRLPRHGWRAPPPQSWRMVSTPRS